MLLQGHLPSCLQRLSAYLLAGFMHSLKPNMCRVEFGTIMLWFYVADRTATFPKGTKVPCARLETSCVIGS